MWAILVNEVVNCSNGDQGDSIPVRCGYSHGGGRNIELIVMS